MLQASNPKELGFLPDRLDRIGAFIQKKYLDTGLLILAIGVKPETLLAAKAGLVRIGFVSDPAS